MDANPIPDAKCSFSDVCVKAEIEYAMETLFIDNHKSGNSATSKVTF